ncbi:MAG: peptidoglycan editing factor PgeF [Chloroflexota bacterium]
MSYPAPPILRFGLFEAVSHGVSSRIGGVSTGAYASFNLGFSTDDDEHAVRENRKRLQIAMGVHDGNVINSWVYHGDNVAVFKAGSRELWPVVRRPVRAGSHLATDLFHADAIISDVDDLHFVLTFADCVPLLFHDRRRNIVGAAHAGWRGTSLAIGPAVLKAMRREFRTDPGDVSVAIGPSIGPCCYAVAGDVLDTFRARGTQPAITGNGVTHLDLWSTNEGQLRDAGISPGSIENPRICTGCHRDRYFSHRAERGVTGRFGLYVGRKPAW